MLTCWSNWNMNRIFMSSDTYEESSYEHNLNLLIFSRLLCVLYPTRRGCKGIIASSRPSYYLKTSEPILEFLKELMALM